VVVADRHEPEHEQNQVEEEGSENEGLVIDEKMGAKKRAKLEAKAEKKAQREAELKAREEQKKRDGECKFPSQKNVDDCYKFLIRSTRR
jgi:hypothetical protein